MIVSHKTIKVTPPHISFSMKTWDSVKCFRKKGLFVLSLKVNYSALCPWKREAMKSGA